MDFSWVVGFFEGEGSVWCNGKVYNPTVCFYQKERRVLGKIRQFLGVGKISKKIRSSQKCRIIYALQISGPEGQSLLRKMIPFMQSEKRRAQAKKVLANIKLSLTSQ